MVIATAPERYNEIKENLHLDKPKVQQFADYTAGIFVGRTFETAGVSRIAPPCLGFSFKNDRPVTEMLKVAVAGDGLAGRRATR